LSDRMRPVVQRDQAAREPRSERGVEFISRKIVVEIEVRRADPPVEREPFLEKRSLLAEDRANGQFVVRRAGQRALFEVRTQRERGAEQRFEVVQGEGFNALKAAYVPDAMERILMSPPIMMKIFPSTPARFPL
jgi:hypothetical protein